MTLSSKCPVCDGAVGGDTTTIVGELLECTDCGSLLVVEALRPFALSEAPQTEEDWGE